MNWKKLTPDHYSDKEEKLLRITTMNGNIIHETGVSHSDGELWHHSNSSAFPSRYLGNVSQHKEVHFVVIDEILF